MCLLLSAQVAQPVLAPLGWDSNIKLVVVAQVAQPVLAPLGRGSNRKLVVVALVAARVPVGVEVAVVAPAVVAPAPAVVQAALVPAGAGAEPLFRCVRFRKNEGLVPPLRKLKIH